MRWRSAPALPEKRRRAVQLVLALAALLLRGGERVALLGDGEPPVSGHNALPGLSRRLLQAAATTGLPGTELPRHAHLLLVSDFLLPLERMEQRLRGWAGSGARGHLLHLLDPAEESLPYDGRIRFEGLEGEGSLLVAQAESLREAYVRRLAEHRDGLERLARRLGWSITSHRTDATASQALLALYQALGRPLPGGSR